MKPEDGSGDEKGEQEGGEYPWGAEDPDDGSPEEVVLLFDSEGPGGSDCRGQSEVKEILDEENIGPPGCGAECFEDREADEPGCIEVADDENEDVDGPDAEGASSVEVAEVAGPGAGFEKDGGDEESGEDEEEVNAGPSPEGGLVEESVFEARMAMVEDDSDNGDAAESLKFGDVGGEPGWALNGQRIRMLGRS